MRIGATRRPPRGIRRARWQRDDYFDVWFPILAPSAALLARFKHRDFKEAYVRRLFFDAYEREILARAESRQAVEFVAALVLRTPISIGCYCDDETRCHRSRLFSIIKRTAAKIHL